MKKTIIAILLTFVCIATITTGCGEQTTKKPETKQETKKTGAKQDKDKEQKDTSTKEEVKTTTYYAKDDGIIIHTEANETAPTERTLKLNDEVLVMEELNDFYKVLLDKDEIAGYVKKDQVSKEKIVVSAQATPTNPTSPTTPTTPNGTQSKPSTSTSTTTTTKPSSTTTTTKPSTSTTTPTTPTTNPSTPTPAPTPSNPLFDHPELYVPIPAGWNQHNSVSGPQINATQKAYIDGLVNNWKNGGMTDSALQTALEQYLNLQGVSYMYVSVHGKSPFITNVFAPTITPSSNGAPYYTCAHYSTGVKNKDSNMTNCYEYTVLIG